MIGKRGTVIRVTAFFILFAMLFFGMTQLFTRHPDPRVYQYVAGFYEEPRETLHAVYIGSSNCYAFWNPLVAWHGYGLAVYPLATPSQPFEAAEYLIQEARKTQPDAVFIVNLNSLEEDDLSAHAIYNLLNYMPESENKTNLMNALSDRLGYGRWERLAFRFPWIRIREYWLTLLKNGFHQSLNGLKGSGDYSTYLEESVDISEQYVHTDVRETLPADLLAIIDELMDYCARERVRVVFVTVPRAEKSAHALARINAAAERIRARGGEVLALTDSVEAIGLDLTRDYYNEKHMNLHGSIKFTDYLSEYLIDRFGLEDRRGDSAYVGWDEGWEKYRQIIAPYLGPEELEVDR